MDDQSRKTMRNFYCRDYLWELYEAMAGDFDCSIDFLINEAMRHYARSKNYSPPSVSAEPMEGNVSRMPSPVMRVNPQMGAPRPMAAPSPSPYSSGRMPSMRSPAINSRPAPMPPNGGGIHSPRPPTMAAEEIPPMAPAPDPLAPPPGGRPLRQPPPPNMRPTAIPGGRPPGMVRPSASPTIAAPPGPMSKPYEQSPYEVAPAPRPMGGMPPQGRPSMAPARPPLTLIFQGQRYPVDKDEFIIGRGSKTSDLAIKDGNVSRKHAAVIYRNGQYFIKDCGSTNGIDYNGMRIDNKKIEEGDVFFICDYELRFTYR